MVNATNLDLPPMCCVALPQPGVLPTPVGTKQVTGYATVVQNNEKVAKVTLGHSKTTLAR